MPELRVLYLVMICIFPHGQGFDLNAVPTHLPHPSTGKVDCSVCWLFVLVTRKDFASGLIFPRLGVGTVGLWWVFAFDS